MKNIWISARMTFREAIRRRIVLTGLVLGLCFLIIFSIGFHMIYNAAYLPENRCGQSVLFRSKVSVC